MAAPDDLRSRMAVVEAKMHELDDETRRVRDRLHDVENDRMAVRLLAQKLENLERQMADRVVDLLQRIKDVSSKVDTLPDTIHGAAQRAGQDAVREVLRAREESGSKTWANRIALGVALIAFLGLIVQAIAAVLYG